MEIDDNNPDGNDLAVFTIDTEDCKTPKEFAQELRNAAKFIEDFTGDKNKIMVEIYK